MGPSLSLAQQIWLCIHSLGAFTVQQWADSHHPWHDCVTVKKKKKKAPVKKSRMKDSFKQLIFYFFSYLDQENVSPCVLKIKYPTFNQFLHTVWWLQATDEVFLVFFLQCKKFQCLPLSHTVCVWCVTSYCSTTWCYAPAMRTYWHAVKVPLEQIQDSLN